LVGFRANFIQLRVGAPAESEGTAERLRSAHSDTGRQFCRSEKSDADSFRYGTFYKLPEK